MKRSGFTLLEMVVAMTIATVVTYTLAGAVSMAHRSHKAVMQGVAENSFRRSSSKKLIKDMKSANRSSVVVGALPDGNAELTFRLPIYVDGDPAWGVFDPKISNDVDKQSKEDWSVKYTVKPVALEGGGIERQLVRQVIDDQGDLKFEVVVASGLRSGTDTPRGFEVVAAGKMWEITLAFESEVADGDGGDSVFHVGTRN